MKIKKATEKDIKVLLGLRKKLHEYEREIEKSDKFNSNEITEVLNDKKVSFFIAYNNDVPVGYSKLKIKEINNEIMGHIGAIFVLEEFRNKEIGKLLFEPMFDILRKKNIKKASIECYKKNKLSIKVYQKLGFRIVEHKGKLYRLEKFLC